MISLISYSRSKFMLLVMFSPIDCSIDLCHLDFWGSWWLPAAAATAFSSSARSTAWSPLEPCLWAPSPWTDLMRDFSTSCHITVSCTWPIQSAFLHYCQCCRQRYFKIQFRSRIWPPTTKEQLVSGSHWLSEWGRLFVTLPPLCLWKKVKVLFLKKKSSQLLNRLKTFPVEIYLYYLLNVEVVSFLDVELMKEYLMRMF